MRVAWRVTAQSISIVAAAILGLACSWDYPVWPKSKRSDTPLFRFVVRERDGAGYIDREGHVVIPPTLFHFGNYGDDDFFDGLAKVRMNGEDWYIDPSGKRIFPAHYLSTGTFSEGLVSIHGNIKAGFADREGRLVIPRWSSIQSASSPKDWRSRTRNIDTATSTKKATLQSSQSMFTPKLSQTALRGSSSAGSVHTSGTGRALASTRDTSVRSEDEHSP